MGPPDVTFLGKMSTLHVAPHAPMRMSPALHTPDARPPIPQEGDVIAMETPMGQVAVRVLESGSEGMVIDLRGERWRVSLVTPAEGELVVASYVEGSGASDWLIRGEA